jgi:hypothetical protein
MFNLLTSHRRFDLIYQCWPEAGGHFPQYSLEWCERLARAAAPEGFVVIDVPHAGLTERALDLIASTVARACGGRVAVAPVSGPLGQTLRLAAPVNAAALGGRPGSAPWSALIRIRESAAPIHSLTRDRITSRLGSESPTAPKTAALSPL